MSSISWHLEAQWSVCEKRHSRRLFWGFSLNTVLEFVVLSYRPPGRYSCLENPMGRGAWSAMVHRVTNRETCLKPWIIVSVDKTISLRPGTGRTPFTWKIYSLLSGAQRGQHVLLASAVSQVPLIQNNPPMWYIWDGVFCCPQVHSLVTAPDIQTV